VFVRRQLFCHVQTFAEQALAFDRIALLAKENSQMKERVRDQRVFVSERFAPDGQSLAEQRLGFGQLIRALKHEGQVGHRGGSTRMFRAEEPLLHGHGSRPTASASLSLPWFS